MKKKPKLFFYFEKNIEFEKQLDPFELNSNKKFKMYQKNACSKIAKNIQPSPRGEYEITDVNKAYLEANKLEVRLLDRGSAWLDTGTFKSLMQASQFVEVIEERQGLKIGCIEEAAYKMGYIDNEQLERIAQPLLKSGYGKYLLSIIK